MWINVTERLPPVGVRVPVKGDYTPDDVRYPVAWINDEPGRAAFFGVKPGEKFWESREWRGSVGIRFWWEGEQTNDDAR